MKDCKILSGSEVYKELNLTEIDQFSKEISQLIQQLPHLMKQFSESEIKQYITNGQTIILLDQDKPVGFVKYMIHPKVDERTKDIVEIGSLILLEEARGQGLGTILVSKCTELAKRDHPHLKIISVVSIKNIASNKILNKLGAKKIDMPSNVPHMIPGVKHIYQLSEININFKTIIKIFLRNLDTLYKLTIVTVKRSHTKHEQ